MKEQRESEDLGRMLRNGEIQKTDKLPQALNVGKEVVTGRPATAGATYAVPALPGNMMTHTKAAVKALKILQSSAFPPMTADIYRQAMVISAP